MSRISVPHGSLPAGAFVSGGACGLQISVQGMLSLRLVVSTCPVYRTANPHEIAWGNSRGGAGVAALQL